MPADGSTKSTDGETLTRAQKAARTRQQRKAEQAAADAKVMETVLPPRQARATPKRMVYSQFLMCYYLLMICALAQRGKHLPGVGSGNVLNHHLSERG